jgi:hypothetical protein
VGQVSEHDDEPREDFGGFVEPEDSIDHDHETGEVREQTPQEAADDDGSDALIKKAEKAQTNYAKRIRDIFGDNAPQYDCPTCNGLGLIWELEVPTRKLKHPPELVPCQRCDGWGEVETGSKNPLHETTVCTACNATGWKVQTPQAENVTPILPNVSTSNAAQATPVMGWQQPDGTFVPLGTPQAGNG